MGLFTRKNKQETPKHEEEETAYAVDGLTNPVSGMGTYRDKAMFTDYYIDRPVDMSSYIRFENMYFTFGLARRIVDSVADDMMREGVEVVFKDESQASVMDALDEEEKRINLHSTFHDALKWARLYGGSAVVLFVRDDNLSEPLDIESIGKNDLQGIQVFDNIFCTALSTLDTNPLNNSYGINNFAKPVYYQIQSYNATMQAFEPLEGGMVHHTRIIRFDGEKLTRNMLLRNNFWGSSVLQTMFQSLVRYDKALHLINSMMEETTIDVISSPLITEMYGAGGIKNFRKTYTRFKNAVRDKSIYRALLLGDQETYTKIQNSFGGIAEILKDFVRDVSAQCGIPQTILWGDSPKGLGSTGDHETRNYYDRMQSNREQDLGPKYMLMYRIIMRSLTGRDVPFSLSFPPLWQPTDLEQAQIELTRAQTDNIYLTANAISTQDVLLRLKQNETYNITKASESIAKMVDDKVIEGDDVLEDDEDESEDETTSQND